MSKCLATSESSARCPASNLTIFTHCWSQMFLTNLDYCHTVQGNIFANHRRSHFIHPQPFSDKSHRCNNISTDVRMTLPVIKNVYHKTKVIWRLLHQYFQKFSFKLTNFPKSCTITTVIFSIKHNTEYTIRFCPLWRQYIIQFIYADNLIETPVRPQ